MLRDILQATETVDPQRAPNSEFEYIDVSSVSNKTLRIEQTQTLNGKQAPSRARRRVKTNDILFATVRPTLRRIAQVPAELDGQICSTGYFVLRPKPAISARYLFYFLQTEDFNARMELLQKGASYPAVTDGDVRNQPISFPPLFEQRRIVGILDKAFAAIAVTKANAERNLQDARALFESHLQATFTRCSKGWVEKKLADVCVVERGSSPRPIKNFLTTEPDGVNWIKIGDTIEGEKYVYGTKQKITPEGAKSSRFVKENDLILTNSMSFGRPYIMKTSGYIHDGWFVLRLNESIDLDYFYYLIASSFVRSQFNSLASGSVVLNISSDLVKQAKLPIPPLAEQQSLAGQFRDFASRTQRLESIYEQKLIALDTLRQSLLDRAFSGAL